MRSIGGIGAYIGTAAKENERFTLLAVVGVTVLSTLSMVLYPFALKLMGLPAAQAGFFWAAPSMMLPRLLQRG